jgi:microsomal epoxide hydrolase
MPLLLSHGWPGSIVEFERIIPMLTDPARFGGDPADAFTVVAPSLPGYAFSSSRASRASASWRSPICSPR